MEGGRVVVQMDRSRVVDAHQMRADARDRGGGMFCRDISGAGLTNTISHVYLILDRNFHFRLLTKSRPAA